MRKMYRLTKFVIPKIWFPPGKGPQQAAASLDR